jgi:SAM-dependent methyltransferase
MDSRAWDERYAGQERVWSAGPNQFVEAALADLPPGRAVDLAAGEGRNALWLAGRGWQVTAVDFSRVGLDKGRAAAGDLPIEWVCQDVLEWEGADYDLALVAYLQVAAGPRREAVRRAFAALRPGGTLFWVAHDTSNLTEGTGGPPDPSRLMTAEDVLGDLAGQDLEVQRAERVARRVEPEQPGEPERTAYDCLVQVTRG